MVAFEDQLTCSHDQFLGNKLVVMQPRNGHHRSGTDAVLLAACVPANASDVIVDLGAGVGVAGLCIATRVSDLHLVLAEIDPQLCELANDNCQNGLKDSSLASFQILNTDITLKSNHRIAAGLRDNMANHVICNPPFYHPDKFRASPDSARARAHMLTDEGLEPWFRAATSVLKHGGTFSMIHRADALEDLLAQFGRRFGNICIKPLYPRPNSPAHRIIVQGTKGSKAPIQLLEGFTLQDGNGNYSCAAEQIHRDGTSLPMVPLPPQR
ncbi:MAG: methyltransferase [Cohaesibacteraceae bacterium]|nr:methyltransferase [Cohaesibacteraceae bacterium]